MDKTQSTKQKAQKQVRRQNVLEVMKEVGASTAKSLNNDVLKGSAREFMAQLLGRMPKKHFEGELEPGKSMEPDKVKNGQHEKEQKLQKQLGFERRVREEEKVLLEKKTNDLKLQIHAITTEIAKVAHATPQLANEVQVASFQAPANPGVYHVAFFEKVLAFIQSFRKNIESASAWLGAANKRAQKKTFWGMYKKHGGKRLLSSEDYLQRSAG